MSRRDSGLITAAAAAVMAEEAPSAPTDDEAAAEEDKEDPMDGPLGSLGDAVMEAFYFLLASIHPSIVPYHLSS